MDKPTKHITIDFDLWVKEKQDSFKKGITDGYSFAMKAVTVYLKKGGHIKDFITGEYTPDWEPLLKALGREQEWKEFLEHRKEQEKKQAEAVAQHNPKKEEECQQYQL